MHIDHESGRNNGINLLKMVGFMEKEKNPET